ncbi:LysR substrate-binding domain-containing protein, partial [Pseudomonas aeruginosa]
ESSSLELSRQLARRGLGVAFQTRLGIEADIAQGELRFLPLKDNGGIHSDLGLYVRTGRYLPVAVDALARQIAEEVRLREREEARLNEA